MAFIIDSYNKYDSWDRNHSVYKFNVNGNQYAVKEVEIDWGLPVLGERVDRENMPEFYCIYETLDEAMGFVKMMRRLNCGDSY